MPGFALSLLGPFRASLGDEPVDSFRSRKTCALLAYLAVESERTHSREALAGLLWPDCSTAASLTSLRSAIANLRQAIGDTDSDAPRIHVTRSTFQFRPSPTVRVDVLDLRHAIARYDAVSPGSIGPDDMMALELALALRHGPFLDGFGHTDSVGFEEWMLLVREQVDREYATAVHRLTAHLAAGHNLERAESWTRRLLAIQPWDESAYRDLMRWLAQRGDRTAALEQFDACRRALAAELGVKPSEETNALMQELRDRSLPAGMPAHLLADTNLLSAGSLKGAANGRQPFFGRQKELHRLTQILDQGMSEPGAVALITGDAGSGKTALMTEFARRACSRYPSLLTASGICTSKAGFGDPLMPFREILQRLTGDAASRGASGAFERAHAVRIREALPVTLEALRVAGPDLVGTLIPAESLLQRAQRAAPAAVPWLTQVAANSRRASRANPRPRRDLFEQVTEVLRAVSEQHPLLLTLDDLQWADAASIDLLFHLTRRLSDSKVLLLCSYRPLEPYTDGGPPSHPLQSAINEVVRDYGDVCIDLRKADGRQFIDACLDSQPNRFDAEFRAHLLQQTGGHALFTTELIRNLRERGEIRRDKDGNWLAGGPYRWDRLPARVEAVIEERISRLPQEWRQILSAASVEGAVFSAEVVAGVLGKDPREVALILSGPLCARHDLVTPMSVVRLTPTGQCLSLYRFRHDLFATYFHNRIDAVTRAHACEATARQLETLYAGSQPGSEAISRQLAWLFELGDLPLEAARCLLVCARRAQSLADHEEAIELLQHAVALLSHCPDSTERDRLELSIELELGIPFKQTCGCGAPAHVRAFE